MIKIEDARKYTLRAKKLVHIGEGELSSVRRATHTHLCERNTSTA